MSCCPEAAPSSWGKSDATGGKNHLEQYDDACTMCLWQYSLNDVLVMQRSQLTRQVSHTHTHVSMSCCDVLIYIRMVNGQLCLVSLVATWSTPLHTHVCLAQASSSS
jgi:hypothetical protein